MSRTAFPSCCGASILHGLDYADIKTDGDFGGVGLVVAITSPSNSSATKEELRKNGFKELLKFNNPVHGKRALTLWAKHKPVIKPVIKKPTISKKKSAAKKKRIARRIDV